VSNWREKRKGRVKTRVSVRLNILIREDEGGGKDRIPWRKKSCHTPEIWGGTRTWKRCIFAMMSTARIWARCGAPSKKSKGRRLDTEEENRRGTLEEGKGRVC